MTTLQDPFLPPNVGGGCPTSKPCGLVVVLFDPPPAPPSPVRCSPDIIYLSGALPKLATACIPLGLNPEEELSSSSPFPSKCIEVILAAVAVAIAAICACAAVPAMIGAPSAYDFTD